MSASGLEGNKGLPVNFAMAMEAVWRPIREEALHLLPEVAKSNQYGMSERAAEALVASVHTSPIPWQ